MSYKLRFQFPYSFLQGFLHQKYVVFLIRQSQKIFRAVIGLDAIKMMPYFSSFKWASQFFFQYQYMFRNIRVFIGSWMIRFINKNITPTHGD